MFLCGFIPGVVLLSCHVVVMLSFIYVVCGVGCVVAVLNSGPQGIACI